MTLTSVVALPPYIVYSSGTFTLTPVSGEIGAFDFDIQLQDSMNPSMIINFDYRISIYENSAPYFLRPPELILAISDTLPTPYILPASYDPDSDPVSVVVVMTNYGTFNAGTNTFTFDPSLLQNLKTPASALTAGDTFTLSYDLTDNYKYTPYSIQLVVTSMPTPYYSTPPSD